MEGLDLLIPLLLLWRARKRSLFGCFRVANLLIVLVVHHVPKQNWYEPAEERPQHARLDRRFAKRAPELTRLQRHALVAVLQATLSALHA